MLINGRGQKLVGAVSKIGVASEERGVVSPIVGVVSSKFFPRARSLICKSWELYVPVFLQFGSN